MNCPSCHAENEASAWACFACGAPLDPSLAGLAAGLVFASRFEILGPLGRGGMGMVYRARDRELNETVAIKVLRPDVSRQSGRVEQRFRSEIRLARKVRHRNVCSVYGDGEDRGLLYICMELVEGENLARTARQAGGLPEDEAWDAALQVAEGLCAIHEVGVIHRDLKTANLMRDRRGVVRVMDFGIAKQHGGGTGAVTVTATATGSLMGTPEYMSPEQLRGEEVDFRSDLYSLGVVVHELFTGEPPLRGDTAVATIVKQLQEVPSLDAPRLPVALRPVLRRALEKDPAGRYVSVDEMRCALREARIVSVGGEAAAGAGIPGDGVEASDETRPLGSVRPPSREPAPVLRIALALLATAGLAAHLLSAGGVPRADRTPLTAPNPEPRPSPSPTPTPPPTTVVAIVTPASPSPGPKVLSSWPLSRAAAAPRADAPSATPSALPAAVDPMRIYKEDEVDVAPRRVSGLSAPYPEWEPRLARGERRSLTASFLVTEAGDVTDIRVEKGEGALEAVFLEISRWKFTPGLKDGVPVKVRVRWRQTFVGG